MKALKKVAIWTLLVLVTLALGLKLYSKWYVDYGYTIPAARPNTIRIACIGDSITQKIPIIAEERYPQQLEDRLGSGYSVRNFGAIGYSVQKAADKSYWDHRYLRLSSDFAPSIVFIMLGTNDSKRQNWVGPERFTRDYRELIQHYQSLASKPRIILLTPPSAFLVKGHKELPANMSAEHISAISAIVKKLGDEMGLAVIDVHAITAPHPEFFQMDGVHPDANGERLIADAAYAELSKSSEPKN